MSHDSYPDHDEVESENELENAVAVLSVACRFPGADSPEEFWQNLAEGKETITFFTDEEMRASGKPEEWIQDPNYVQASPNLKEIRDFDAAFFDMTPREAEILDPQSRIFLEICWEALERGGYPPRDHDGWIGVFGGTSFSTYQLGHLLTRNDVMAEHGWFPIYLANDRDYFTTRVSYKLGLRGPSMNLQTACSTSLVAVHAACQSLLDYQCTLALAGGVRVGSDPTQGYVYQPGGITSPDGHCRSFDAGGNGSLFGSGAGVVLLKRLEEALEDGDPILAVIRGSAINNDGAAKVGFTAPSIEGQAEVVTMALEAAEVNPRTISYMEGHGSATALGDPIEVAALTEAYRAETDAVGYCALGSVKSNFGHLEAASGIAGFIKTVLAIENRQIPPSLHFESPNPQLELETSPFFVNTTLRPWETESDPLRAGVSSFGMGGTNAHIILEEPPEVEPSGASRPHHLLLLSARSSSALDDATARLRQHLEENDELDLADVAYTLAVGRRAFEHRRAVLCTDRDDALAALDAIERQLTLSPPSTGRAVAFLLPGLGEHYPGMTRGLYQQEPVFRREVDRCAEILEPLLGRDLRSILYPEGAAEETQGGLDFARMLGRRSAASSPPSELDATRFAQPAVFVVEYALARLWQSFGVVPQALIGHSLGEYVAACIAEVLPLEHALRLVAERARLIDALPAGTLLAVPLPEAEIGPYLGDELDVSAVNGPEVTVVAGPLEAIAALEARLTEEGHACRRLSASHAFHSRYMEPAAAPLLEILRDAPLGTPAVPILSNVTGTWLKPEEARDPEYWAHHLRRTVRFNDGVAELLKEDRVLLEVGPGQGLGALVMQHPEGGPDRAVVPSLRSPYDRREDQAVLLQGLARLWLAGVTVDWRAFFGNERRQRVLLPTYPFERQRCWIDPPKPQGQGQGAAAQADGAAESAGAAGAAGAVEPDAHQTEATYHRRPELPTTYREPRNELEERVTGVWQEVLGIAPIGIDDSYFDMGGHSLLAPRMVMRLSKALDLELPLEILLENPTVARLGEAVEAVREGKAVLATAVDLAAEVYLAEDIQPAADGTASVPPAAVLLTGGTGFLGAHLAHELAEQTDARLVCLVRGADADAAMARLRANLEHHKVWRDELAERLEVLPADLAQPHLGLSEDHFERLAREVDLVIHAGAWVNFTYPYSVLAPANVEGTREALRLAALFKTKPFHFISSTAVYTPESYAGGRAQEDDPLIHTAGLFSGYAETKWACEKILGLAEERGLPVVIHRPGVISGHSTTGVGNTSDMVWNVIKGCVQMGASLDAGPLLDVTPVDFVARAVVHLALAGERFKGTRFGFANPHPIPYTELFSVVRSLGYPVRPVDYRSWRAQLVETAEQGVENALVPFLPLFPPWPEEAEAEAAVLAESRPKERQAQPSMLYDDRNLRAALEDSDIRCPPFDEPLLRTYLGYFIQSGFLDPPPSTETGEI